ncbi:uncharacterized protein [Diabrotica undecimpunctata]|uniref:uncharacterized protein n=1 Tax=Diabrotica undecimpunctata TaxID=50387 RepID=UPI003B64231F
MGALPDLRISKAKPFSCVGVDFGGPFLIQANKLKNSKRMKAYICLFVCFATKALHLELVSKLSTGAFLASFRRFIARRGRCSVVYSDCGTNFVEAKSHLKDIKSHFDKNDVITWHLNPPAASHFGGLFEAGIKSVKTHVSRLIGEQVLTYEEFNTLLIQIEAVLNSRPLCPVSNDPNDFSVLTPGHFLILEPLKIIPDRDYSDVHLNRLSRWQLLQRLHADFWQRWSREYLHTLHQRSKWHKNEGNPNIGTLVLIRNETEPPLQWQMGRIKTLIFGQDDITRVAIVQTAKGELRRPLVKLCPLPYID